MKKAILCYAMMLCICRYPTETAAHAGENTPLMDSENIAAVTATFHDAVPSENGDTLLFVGNAVWYCDPAVSDKKQFFCSDPDCRHISDDCSAYIGNVSSFIPYHGIWYYLRTQDNGSIHLIRHDPASNTRTVLKTYAADERTTVSLEMISHGDLFVRKNGTAIHDENVYSEHSETEMIDLETGQTRNVFPGPFFVIGGNEDSFAALKIIDYFIDKTGKESQTAELCIFSRDDLSCRAVAGNESALSADHLGSGRISGSTLLYTLSDGLYAYNLDNGTQKKIASGNIVYYAVYGGSVYYASGGDISNADFFRCHIDGSRTVRMENEGLHHVRSFSVYRATENGFYGMDSSGRYGWISQENFDQERYGQMVTL